MNTNALAPRPIRRVCIVGASGKLGKYMVQHALDRGYEVVGVCREQSVPKLARFAGRITVIPGRTNDREVIRRAVAGCDGVLTVLMPWGMQQYASGTAQAVLDYAEPGARLVFSCGWHVTRDGKDVYSRFFLFVVAMFAWIARLVRFAQLDDQLEATRRIFESDRDWTVVRGSDLEEGPSQGLPVWSRHVGDAVLKSNLTRRVDFALFMVEALTDPALSREAPAIVGCRTPSALTHAAPAAVLAIAALAFGCAAPGPDRVGLTPAAPEYALHGPHWVGFQRFEAPGTDGTDSMRIGIWYPARNPAGAAEALTYETTLDFGGFETPAIVEGSAIADASLADDDGPFPVIVFSHGFALRPELYSTLVEHYASHGFVVLAPDHADGGDWIESAWQATADRPRDIQRTLAFAEALDAPGGAFAGALDLEHIALVGHSFGGYTALAMAGARIDLDGFHTRCGSLAPEDPKGFLCAAFLGREADMAARAGLPGVPEGLWPAAGDPRITAIVPIAGDAFLFNEAGLSSIAIPMMAIGGTADFGTPFEWGARLAYDGVSSERKAIAALEGADHMVAANPCDIMPWTEALPPEYQAFVCSDPAWDKPYALDLIRHFSTAFVIDQLRGDGEARDALRTEAIRFDHIAYETTLE